MEIRRLAPVDAEKLVAMVKAFRIDTSNSSVARRFLENPANYVIAAIQAGQVIGFLLSYQLQRYDGQADMIYIHEVGVLAEYRRQGIGKKLIHEMLRICKENQFSKAFLITQKSNTPAVCLYEATGAKASHDDDIVYWYNNFDDLINNLEMNPHGSC